MSNRHDSPEVETPPPSVPRRYIAAYIALGVVGAIAGLIITIPMGAFGNVNTLTLIGFTAIAPMLWYRIYGGGTI